MVMARLGAGQGEESCSLPAVSTAGASVQVPGLWCLWKAVAGSWGGVLAAAPSLQGCLAASYTRARGVQLNMTPARCWPREVAPWVLCYCTFMAQMVMTW